MENLSPADYMTVYQLRISVHWLTDDDVSPAAVAAYSLSSQ